MNLSYLLVIHAFITLAAGIVLIASPELIPATVDIQLTKSQYLLSYFLGAAEIALAFLSFESRKLKDEAALRMVCLAFILFHLGTAGVEIYAMVQGASAKIWANVVLRLVISGLFGYFGLYGRRKSY